jgi:hypothetical protein
MIHHDAKCRREIIFRIVVAKKKKIAAFDMKNNIFSSKLDLDLGERLMKCYIWSVALCGAENMVTWECTSESINVVLEKDGEDQLDRSGEK